MKILFGSQNFGMDIESSDKDYIQFVWPDVGDLCKPIPKAKESSQDDGSIIKRIDVRTIPDIALKSNLDFIQLLYSAEYDENDDIVSVLRQHEREISEMNIPRLYKSVMGSTYSRMKRGNTKDLVHCLFGMELLHIFHINGFTNMKNIFEVAQRSNRYRNFREWTDSDRFESLYHLVHETIKRVATLEDDYMAVPVQYEVSSKLQTLIGTMIVDKLNNQ